VQSTNKKTVVYVVLAQLALLAASQLLAHSGVAGLTVPAPASVMRVYLQPRFAALLYRSALATVTSAAGGFAAGALLGTVTAMVAYVLPPLRPGLDRLAVTVNAIPAIVLGPIFILLVSRELTPALLAAISVFFLIYVAVASGLRTASAGLTAMMTTFGAGRWQRLRYLDLPSAVPSLLSGVKVSVTAAMIGAVVGEWFGAPTGLGIVILNTMQNFEIPLMWAAVLLVALISLAGYGAAHAAERYVARRFL
jgi:ABC-type nitrate/sulfonate/bicarbonate transport system permease component